MSTKRPINSGRHDSRGHRIMVSDQTVSQRSDAPPPPAADWSDWNAEGYDDEDAAAFTDAGIELAEAMEWAEHGFHDLADIVNQPTKPWQDDEPPADLPDLGISADQWQTTTGFGLRNIAGCQNTDTLANKYRAGALTAIGVMGALFGHDSPQHHAGHNRPEPPAKATGITPTAELLAQFDEHGIDEPLAGRWMAHGFMPGEALQWHRLAFEPEETAGWDQRGITQAGLADRVRKGEAVIALAGHPHGGLTFDDICDAIGEVNEPLNRHAPMSGRERTALQETATKLDAVAFSREWPNRKPEPPDPYDD